MMFNTMNNTETGAGYVNSVADDYVNEDGRSGRLVELFDAGTPIVWHTHWQSLYSNGRATGLRALDEICRRVSALWGDQINWMKCSELAAAIANSNASENGIR